MVKLKACGAVDTVTNVVQLAAKGKRVIRGCGLASHLFFRPSTSGLLRSSRSSTGWEVTYFVPRLLVIVVHGRDKGLHGVHKGMECGYDRFSVSPSSSSRSSMSSCLSTPVPSHSRGVLPMWLSIFMCQAEKRKRVGRGSVVQVTITTNGHKWCVDFSVSGCRCIDEPTAVEDTCSVCISTRQLRSTSFSLKISRLRRALSCFMSLEKYPTVRKREALRVVGLCF